MSEPASPSKKRSAPSGPRQSASDRDRETAEYGATAAATGPWPVPAPHTAPGSRIPRPIATCPPHQNLIRYIGIAKTLPSEPLGDSDDSWQRRVADAPVSWPGLTRPAIKSRRL